MAKMTTPEKARSYWQSYMKKINFWPRFKAFIESTMLTSHTTIYINDQRVDHIPDWVKKSAEDMQKSMNEMFDQFKKL